MSWRPFVAIAGIIIVSVIVTLAEIPSATWLSLAALSLSMGVAALALMAAAAILGGRWRFMESVLGGLDRVYLTHKWIDRKSVV